MPIEPDLAAPIACPKCHVTMARLDAGGTQADRCHKCGGVWLDRGELDALMKSKGGVARVIADLDNGPSAEPTAKRHVVGGCNCPRDATRLRTVLDPRQSHLAYEACPSCGGLFFDCGELGDLSQFTLRERLAGLFSRK